MERDTMGDNLRLGIDGRLLDDRPEIRAGAIGCGSHAFRNVYPTFQFTPVNLVATCDLVEKKAERYADQFGAERSYREYEELLECEDLDAVFVILNLDDEGRPRYPEIAADVLRAGCHAWIEKPPAASVEEIEELMAIEEATDRFVGVGFKKAFSPAVEKAAALIDRDEFGTLDTLSVRYPLPLPDRDEPSAPVEHGPDTAGLLDLAHPGAVLVALGGSMEQVSHRSGIGRGGFATVDFTSGAVGNLHLADGVAGTSTWERVEAVGDRANLVIENGVELTYYRPGSKGEYGITPDYFTDIEEAPLCWKPEHTLAQLYNKNLFTQGFYQEIRNFAECCLEDRPPEKGNLKMAQEITMLYEALLQAEDTAVDL